MRRCHHRVSCPAALALGPSLSSQLSTCQAGRLQTGRDRGGTMRSAFTFTARSSHGKGAAEKEHMRTVCLVFPLRRKIPAKRAGGPELTLLSRCCAVLRCLWARLGPAAPAPLPRPGSSTCSSPHLVPPALSWPCGAANPARASCIPTTL